MLVLRYQDFKETQPIEIILEDIFDNSFEVKNIQSMKISNQISTNIS